MSHLVRRAIILAVATLTFSTLGVRAAAAAHEACDLVSAADVAKAVGNATDKVMRNAAAIRDGATMSSCAYYASSGAGNNATITMAETASGAAAEARLKSYGEALVKGGGSSEADTVGGQPALYVAGSISGSAQMFAVKGNVLVGARVGSLKDGKPVPLRDRSRELLAAALRGL